MARPYNYDLEQQWKASEWSEDASNDDRWIKGCAIVLVAVAMPFAIHQYRSTQPTQAAWVQAAPITTRPTLTNSVHRQPLGSQPLRRSTVRDSVPDWEPYRAPQAPLPLPPKPGAAYPLPVESAVSWLGALWAMVGAWLAVRHWRSVRKMGVEEMAMMAVKVDEGFSKSRPELKYEGKKKKPRQLSAAERQKKSKSKLRAGRWRVFNVEVPASDDPGKDVLVTHDALHQALCKRLGIKPGHLLTTHYDIVRKSFDGRPTRKHGIPKFSYVVDVSIDHRMAGAGRRKGPMELAPQEAMRAPIGLSAPLPKLAIVGAGPAGLFAALRLVEAGAGPGIVIYERGQPVEQRGRDIGALFHRRVLNKESNVCYGEGGAGTWSDGKLTSQIGRNTSHVRHVLETLNHFGAPDQILVNGKPHMGTDKLVNLLRNARAHLLEAGVTFKFGSKVDGFEGGDNGTPVTGIRLSDGSVESCDYCVLAMGHSSRDLVKELYRLGGDNVISAKPFAVGFRVEHPQDVINQMQLGEWAQFVDRGKGPIPVADYKLASGMAGGSMGGDEYSDIGTQRGVYSFCMCPGGQIVATATEEQELCINGMSFSRRQSKWANSALVVTVTPEDWAEFAPPGTPPALAGIAFQQYLERRAAEMGGGGLTVPVQRLVDFLKGEESIEEELPQSSYRLGVKAAPLHEFLPDHMYQTLRKAVAEDFDRKLPGFATCPEALVHAAETRTSSPVRVARDTATYECPALPNLFPCGEGAGYAGGIVSASVDGLRVADAVLARVKAAQRPAAEAGQA